LRLDEGGGPAPPNLIDAYVSGPIAQPSRLHRAGAVLLWILALFCPGEDQEPHGHRLIPSRRHVQPADGEASIDSSQAYDGPQDTMAAIRHHPICHEQLPSTHSHSGRPLLRT